MMDDRAVSTAVSYVLIVSLALLLTTGLVLGTESLIEDQREETIRQQLEVVGQQLAGTVMTVDRFNETEAVPQTATVTRQFPERIAGSQYRITVAADSPDDGRYTIYLDAVDTNVNVSVPVRAADTDVRSTRLNGGTVRVAYVDATAEVVVRSA
jgi:seryl-tRNA(Sec) selenium transferase